MLNKGLGLSQREELWKCESDKGQPRLLSVKETLGMLQSKRMLMHQHVWHAQPSIQPLFTADGASDQCNASLPHKVEE